MRIRCALVASTLLVLGSLAANPASAELITIVEFYNTTLKHFVLITDPNEVEFAEGIGMLQALNTDGSFNTLVDLIRLP